MKLESKWTETIMYYVDEDVDVHQIPLSFLSQEPST